VLTAVDTAVQVGLGAQGRPAPGMQPTFTGPVVCRQQTSL
jgi:hypothetical protein